MNIAYLKFAVEVADAGSISKAAENTLAAAPNVSRAIKELEADLGITIFERSAKGMSLTPDGEELIAYARKILSQLDDLERMYRQDAPARQRFSISVPRASYISDAFARFSKSIAPGPAEIYYKETNPSRVLKNILNENYHMGILRYAAHYERHFMELLKEKDLCFDNVATFRYLLVMNRESPLASRREIRFSDLRSMIEIAHADPFVPSLPVSTVRREELPEDIDRRIFVFERGSQFDLLAENPETFMWVSPLPQNLLERYGLVQRECVDNQRDYKDILIHRTNYTFTEMDQMFVEELHRSKERIFREALEQNALAG